jgi:hypothetical protein
VSGMAYPPHPGGGIRTIHVRVAPDDVIAAGLAGVPDHELVMSLITAEAARQGISEDQPCDVLDVVLEIVPSEGWEAAVDPVGRAFKVSWRTPEQQGGAP